MESAVIILEIILVLGLLFLYQQVKELPKQIHERSLKELEHELSKKLETFRNNLTTELEEFKISRSELQIRKSEEFTRFIVSFIDFLNDPEARNNPKAAEKYVKETMEFGGRIFLYGSDVTIKKYVEYRRYGQSADPSTIDPEKVLHLLAEVILEYRKDLGYKDTVCNVDDFLTLIVKDWQPDGKRTA